MKQFIKVTELYRGFFDNIEREQEIIINLHQVTRIYEDEVSFGDDKCITLTPESMESLKEYIECEDCTGKSDKNRGHIKYPNDLTFMFDGVANADEIIEQMRTEGEEDPNE